MTLALSHVLSLHASLQECVRVNRDNANGEILRLEALQTRVLYERDLPSVNHSSAPPPPHVPPPLIAPPLTPPSLRPCPAPCPAPGTRGPGGGARAGLSHVTAPTWRRRSGGAAAEGGASFPGGAAGPEGPPGSRSRSALAPAPVPLPSPAPLPASSCSHRLASRTPALRACSCRGPWRRSWRRRRRSGPRTGSCGEPARWRWVSRPGPARPGPHRAQGRGAGGGPALRDTFPPARVPAGCGRTPRPRLLSGLRSRGKVLPPVQDVQIRGENPQISVLLSSDLGMKQERFRFATLVFRKLVAAFRLGNRTF